MNFSRSGAGHQGKNPLEGWENPLETSSVNGLTTRRRARRCAKSRPHAAHTCAIVRPPATSKPRFAQTPDLAQTPDARRTRDVHVAHDWCTTSHAARAPRAVPRSGSPSAPVLPPLRSRLRISAVCRHTRIRRSVPHSSAHGRRCAPARPLYRPLRSRLRISAVVSSYPSVPHSVPAAACAPAQIIPPPGSAAVVAVAVVINVRPLLSRHPPQCISRAGLCFGRRGHSRARGRLKKPARCCCFSCVA